MSAWSRQRRFIYGGSVISAVLIVAIFGGWKLFYRAPSCFDGGKDGSEQGVDCGGSCQKLCASAFLAPIENWTRFEKVAPGLYNVAAYIVNPNVDGEAFNVPYHMQIYDDKGILITEYNNKITLPPHRNTLAFQGVVNLRERVPAKALFEFTGTPDWHKKTDPLASLSIGTKKYDEDATGSSLGVSLKNTGAKALGRFTVYAVLYDQAGNAIGFSRTVIDGIAAGGTVIAPFTWPVDRHGAAISIEVLPVAE